MRTLLPLILFALAPTAFAGGPYLSPISCAPTREAFDLTTATVYLDQNKGPYEFTLYGGPVKVSSTWIEDTYEVLNGRDPNAYLRRLTLKTVPDADGFLEATFQYAANREGDKTYPMVCKRLTGQRLAIVSTRADTITPEELLALAEKSCGGPAVPAGRHESRFRPIWCLGCSMTVQSQSFVCR